LQDCARPRNVDCSSQKSVWIMDRKNAWFERYVGRHSCCIGPL